MRRMLAAVLTALVAAGPGPAQAQDAYPTRPVRILVPYAPGGATDIVARIIADQLRQIFGQSFVVENKPGAFGIVAIEEMARAKPDGYTLEVGNVSNNGIAPVLFAKKFTIDYEKSVVPVARIVDLPSFIVATTVNFPPTTMAEFVAYAKQNPGKVRYGSAGVGSFPHFATEVIARHAGLDLVHIPNKGGASAFTTDLLTGDIQIARLNVATATPQIKGGKLRPLAIDADARLPDFPDVPTLGELGFPRAGSSFWQAMFAPAETPKAVLDTLHAAVLKAMEAPNVKEAFAKNSMRPIPFASIEEGKAWLRQDLEDWRKIVREVKIDLTE